MPDWFAEMSRQAAGADEVTPAQPPVAGEQGGTAGPRTDWFAEMSRAYLGGGFTSGGTHETVHGGPQIANLKDSPDPPGIKDSLIMGTIEDQGAQIRFLAGNRFPDLPIADAMERYGVVKGDIVYVGDDGSLYREYPEGWSGAPGKIARFVGENALPVAGGVALGSRAGPAGGVAGALAGAGRAAVGAAGGMGYRKAIGAAHGDPRDFKSDALDLAVEASLNALGWKLGEKFGEKVVDRRVVQDIGKFDRSKAIELQRIAKEYFGIDLTPAETSQLGSLINQQTKAGMGLDEAASTIRDFYKKRAGQVGQAIDDFIGETPHATKVGSETRSVMRQSIDDAEAARTTASAPIYKSTVRDDVLIPEQDVIDFMSDDYIGEVFERVTNNSRYGVLGKPVNSTEVIDAVKKAIDDEVETALRRGDKNAARIMSGKKKTLVDYTDLHYPAYRDARSAYASQSQYVDELENGVEGYIARLKDRDLVNAADIVLKSKNASPVQVANARRLFESQGKTKEWDDLVNLWLRQNWENIKTPLSGEDWGSGAKFRQAVYGTERTRKNMQAALGDRFPLFEKLMDVLEATARVPKGQSITQPAAEYAKREAIEAAPVASALDIDVTRPLSAFNLRDWWIETKTGDWRAKLAEVITSPEAIQELEKLRKLRSLSPSSKDALSIVSTAITKAGAHGAASLLETEPTQLPKAATQEQPREGP